MSELMTRAVGGVALADLPHLSQPLEAAMRQVLQPHPSEIGKRLEVMPSVQREAAQHLALFEASCRPVEVRQVRAWLLGINGAVRNPQGAQDFEIRLAAVMAGLGDTPACVVSKASQREALASFEFFPAVADLAKLWAPVAYDMRARLSALRSIAAAPVIAPPVELTLAEREAILAEHRAKMAPLEAERLAREAAEAAPRRAVGGRPVDPAILEAIRAQSPIVREARRIAAAIAAARPSFGE
ncbi:MAG TPA: hypothetical protein VMV33_17425 [Rhodocyclaceae bacterium]|nr:hypothetical protein [Rhodocyclaceae bacterium]